MGQCKKRVQPYRISPIAWIGIAAILLPEEVDLIIRGEASMIPSTALELINNLLKDLMRCDSPFGGKCILMGGDFRQIFPIVKKGGKRQIIEATLTSYHLCELFQTFTLEANMRAENNRLSDWLLSIGNGKLDVLEIPDKMQCTNDLVFDIYGEEINEELLRNSVLLAARNDDVNMLNLRVLSILQGGRLICESYDYAKSIDGDNTDDDTIMLRYQPEYLGSITPSGLPPHQLELKIGSIVMLIRNLCMKDGLCNGTRMIIRKIQNSILFCSIITGDKKGNIDTYIK